LDHVLPIKHGGHTIESNLVLACLECNRHKGSDRWPGNCRSAPNE
jgi:5-methylcytosine-specific restriction endonuclease McrA